MQNVDTLRANCRQFFRLRHQIGTNKQIAGFFVIPIPLLFMYLDPIYCWAGPWIVRNFIIYSSRYEP